MTAITISSPVNIPTVNHVDDQNGNAIDLLENQIALYESGSEALAYKSFRSARFSLIKNIRKDNHVNILSFEPQDSWARDIKVLQRIGANISYIDHYEMEELNERLLFLNIDVVYINTLHSQRITPHDFQYIIYTAHLYNIRVIFDNSQGALGTIYAPIADQADYVLTNVSNIGIFKNTRIGSFVVKGFSEIRNTSILFHETWIHKIKRNRIHVHKKKILISMNEKRIHEILEEERKKQLEYSKAALLISKWLDKHESILEVVYPGIDKSESYLRSDRYLKNGFGSRLKFSLWDNEYSYAILRGYFSVPLLSGLQITVDPNSKQFYFDIQTTDGLAILRYLQQLFSILYKSIAYRNSLLVDMEQKASVMQYLPYSLTHYTSKRKY